MANKKEKPIGKMTKSELQTLLNQFANRLSGYHETMQQIGRSKKELKDLCQNYTDYFEGETIIDDEGVEKKVVGIKNKLDSLHENSKKYLENIKTDYAGGINTNDKGEKKEVKGIKNQLDTLYKKYEDILNKIETQLEEGATSVELIKTFADKVKEYKWNSIWSSSFFIFSTIIVIIYACILFWRFYSGQHDTSYSLYLTNIAIFGFASWLLLFFSNRRSESKKLEEIYKHKEAMARTYIGYRKTLKDIQIDTEEKDLLDGLMRDLLEAIKQNPSDFIKSRSDHPVRSFFQPKTTKDSSD